VPVATRRLIAILLLTWTLALGLVKSGVQPVYAMRQEMVPACADGCDRGAESTGQNCLAVCMVWCAIPGFSAVSESDSPAFGPELAGPALGFEHFRGLVRHQRPPLPPPRA
jgi:hypothetical protein